MFSDDLGSNRCKNSENKLFRACTKFTFSLQITLKYICKLVAGSSCKLSTTLKSLYMILSLPKVYFREFNPTIGTSDVIEDEVNDRAQIITTVKE